MHRFLIVLICALAAACQTAPRPRLPDYQLTDLTGAYAAFFDRTQGMAPDARVAAFRAEMEPLFPGFYDAARMEGRTQARYDAAIARSFEQFPERRAAILHSAAQFQSMLQPAISSFAEAFPDFHHIGRIYLVHSIGEMDGGTRDINGKSYFIFGADVIALYHTSDNERPFFHHELFHVYHAQFFTDCDPLWCSLWQEGLAVYVSEQLNPGATDAQMSLTIPQPIRPAVDADPARATCAVSALLLSANHDDYSRVFFGDAHLDGLPARVGYYVGYLAVKEAARTHSLRELAHMNHEQALPVLQAALASLATCPAAAGH